jgi:hypothetical protein
MAAVNWNTGISGNWSDRTKWSTGTVPGGVDNVTIDASGTYTVIVDGSDSANSLVFNAPTSTIAILSGKLLYIEGAAITGGTIDGPGNWWTGGVTSITSGQPLTLGGGLTWLNRSSGSSDAGTVNDAGAINVGDAAGLKATIDNLGVFNLTTDAAGIVLNVVNIGGLTQSGIATFINDQGATFAKTGGTGISHLFAN